MGEVWVYTHEVCVLQRHRGPHFLHFLHITLMLREGTWHKAPLSYQQWLVQEKKKTQLVGGLPAPFLDPGLGLRLPRFLSSLLPQPEATAKRPLCGRTVIQVEYFC